MSWHVKSGYYGNTEGRVNANRPWLPEELDFLRNFKGHDSVLATRLGRSIKAVHQKRTYLKRQQLRGVVTMPFTPTKWWRVIGPDRSIWCETSVEEEARAAMRPGDILQRQYEKIENVWQMEE